ncbi:MAG: maltose alpha-D-glucosyltransferase, partial [Cyclobacteriaceae bacterium]|nr:maltose alpha-D-glucosyltransferase [Cyclobacteriaceae bacterium]
MISEKHNLWFKDAIIYQVHVQSFYDSNDDGIGDFVGLIQKLDYVKSLGVNTIWLLPFYPSPMKDGGYDISDFTGIHVSYGKLSDFKKLVREAHKLDIRIVTELVLNHTSDQHKWFQRARKAKPGSNFRNFYVWSETPDKFQDARIIFQDFETSNWAWDPEANAYYWHRFYSHQPDLNYDNPNVRKEIFKVLDFWFKTGVDGLRLDAVPYLFQREGTNCENLPETHDFLKQLRKHIDENHENKMLLAEANQWPEDARQYFGRGDECHMAFHFPLMPRLYMGMKMEDRFPIIDILEQTPDIPDNCQWAIFLRNHDELTLEMVTDEERDYMYKSFAREPEQRINLGIRRRLAPLMENDRRKIEMMNILLFSLPGTPIVYYGDEIGMGDNYYLGDRYGVRTPMQWTADRNAGFSKVNKQRLFLPVITDNEYHYEAINIENQDKNPSSLLWWMRQVISTRKRYAAFSRGAIRFVNSNNPKVLSFIREYQDESMLVIINLSHHSQSVDLDLTVFAGYTPIEVFSLNHFPPIQEDPYSFTLQYRDYFWMQLTKQEEEIIPEGERTYPKLSFNRKEWNSLIPSMKMKLEKIFLQYMKFTRWFRGKSRKIKSLSIEDDFILGTGNYHTYLFFVRVDYVINIPENYVLTGSLAFEREEHEIREENPEAVIAEVEVEDQKGILYDAAYSERFHNALLEQIHSNGKIRGKHGDLVGSPGKFLRKNLSKKDMPLQSKLLAAEQSNTSILYNNQLFLKIYRSPEEGPNPELEIIRNLTEKTDFDNLPPYAGTLIYKRKDKDDISQAILVGFIPNEGNAWDLTQRFIEQYFENILARRRELPVPPAEIPGMLEDYTEEETILL